jgi:hypothetical protein
MADLIVKVTTPDYETWLNAFVSAERGLLDAGINQWTIYQDTWNNNIVMVHFIADDIDRAMAFFRSDEFKQINAESGATGREFFIGQKPGTGAAPKAKAAPKATAAKKPAAKPATRATKTTAKPAETPSAETPAKKPATRKKATT